VSRNDAVLDASNQLTDAMRSAVQMLSVEVERSAQANMVLGELVHLFFTQSERNLTSTIDRRGNTDNGKDFQRVQAVQLCYSDIQGTDQRDREPRLDRPSFNPLWVPRFSPDGYLRYVFNTCGLLTTHTDSVRRLVVRRRLWFIPSFSWLFDLLLWPFKRILSPFRMS